jgi:hypothetical protein
VGVEKLILGELAENSSRQEALQAIVSPRIAFCITGFEAVLPENEFFNSYAGYRQLTDG